jgi:hypothetical protein
MAYECRSCDWLDEREPLEVDGEEQCHRCHSTRLRGFSMKKFTANRNVAWCSACKRLHLSSQKVMYD